MSSNLGYYQPKTDAYQYNNLFYASLTVTTKQKPIVDNTHKRDTNLSITLKRAIESQRNTARVEERNKATQNRQNTINKMALGANVKQLL